MIQVITMSYKRIIFSSNSIQSIRTRMKKRIWKIHFLVFVGRFPLDVYFCEHIFLIMCM